METVELSRPVNLTLECLWAGGTTKPGNVTGFWRKDGQEMSRITAQLENGQYSLRRVQVLFLSQEHHFVMTIEKKRLENISDISWNKGNKTFGFSLQV